MSGYAVLCYLLEERTHGEWLVMPVQNLRVATFCASIWEELKRTVVLNDRRSLMQRRMMACLLNETEGDLRYRQIDAQDHYVHATQ